MVWAQPNNLRGPLAKIERAKLVTVISSTLAPVLMIGWGNIIVTFGFAHFLKEKDAPGF